jgi:RNA polymerase sigma-32 factor
VTAAVLTHPLRAQRKPGPKAEDAPPEVEAMLGDADRVLEMMDSGRLPAEPTTPISVPVNRRGVPLRPLTMEQEKELATRIQQWGCIEARNIFVLANIGLVRKVVNQFRYTGVREEDLMQEGVLGLMRATETFEPNRNVRFSTYCMHWIRAKVQRHLQALQRDDTPRMSEAPMEETSDGRRHRPRTRAISLDDLVGDRHRESAVTVAETVPDETFDAQDEHTFSLQRRDALLRVFDEIRGEMKDRRIDMIIDHRLLAEEPETLWEVGVRVDLSRERVRQLEAKIMNLVEEKLSIQISRMITA